jgi:hypothetical protein
MPQSESTKAIIVRQLEAMPVGQRTSDGYINATAMCQIAGKEWSHYRELLGTVAFLTELSQSLGIPRGLLTHSIINGPRDERGTWVHPQVAVTGSAPDLSSPSLAGKRWRCSSRWLQAKKRARERDPCGQPSLAFLARRASDATRAPAAPCRSSPWRGVAPRPGPPLPPLRVRQRHPARLAA